MERHKRIYHKGCTRSAFKKTKTKKKIIKLPKKEEDKSDSDEDIIYRLFHRFKISIPYQILPISTRGLGFIIRELAYRLHLLSVLPQVDTIYRLTNALYRISLLQLDLKLESALKVVCPKDLCNVAFLETKIPPSFVPAIKSMNIGFTPITDYLNDIGFHKTNDRIYIPRHPRLNDAIPCSPYFVNFENLRKVVQLMSDLKFNGEVRRHFFSHCPIPGARWVIPETPILLNADDIMPKNYGLRHVQEDINFIVICAEYVNRLFPRIVNMTGIKWQKPGCISQTVFSNPIVVRCPPFDKIALQTIFGFHNFFWASENISINELQKGIRYLLGEDVPFLLKDPNCASYRDKSGVNARRSIDYTFMVSKNINDFVDEV